jgi:hypothetical protein
MPFSGELDEVDVVADVSHGMLKVDDIAMVCGWLFLAPARQ